MSREPRSDRSQPGVLRAVIVACLALVTVTLVMATPQEGRVLARHNVIRVFSRKDGGLGGRLMQDRAGRLWIATDMGMVMYDESDNSWQTFSPKTGDLLDDYVDLMAESKDGSIWCGAGLHNPSRAGKLNRYDGRSWETVDLGPALWKGERACWSCPWRYIYSMFNGRDGRLWLGSEDSLVAFDGREWGEPVKLSALLGAGEAVNVDAGLEDREGWLWLGLRKGGVVRWKPGTTVWDTYNPIHEAADLGGDCDMGVTDYFPGVRYLYEDR